MKTQFFLVVNDGGSVRTTKGRPDLKWNEIAIHLNLQLPQQLFQKPQIQASITVDESKVAPTLIDVETANNVKEAIEAATGMEVKLEVLNTHENQ
jgi:hypothetical protein